MSFDAFTEDAWRRWSAETWRRWHQRPRPVPDDCPLCEGAGWATVPDPFFGGALVEQRCPCCQDTTVRARQGRFEDNDGRKVGPR